MQRPQEITIVLQLKQTRCQVTDRGPLQDAYAFNVGKSGQLSEVGPAGGCGVDIVQLD